MSLRALAVLAILLAACVAAILWLGRPGAPAKGPQAELGRILDGPLGEVTAFEIGGPAGSFRIARRADGEWTIARPDAEDADPREVRSYLEGLAGARLVRIAEEKASDLERFGLGAAATVVRIERAGANAPRVVRLGRHSPVGPERYVTLGDGRVFLADLGGIAPERASESFRERRLFPVEPERVRRIAVERPAGRLVLAREGGSWRLVEPVEDLADYGVADGLLRNVTSLAFARESAREVPGAALPPASTVEIAVTVESEHGTARAGIGPASAEHERPASRGDGSGVGVVPDADVAELLRPAEEFREHRPLLFSAADVRGVSIVGSGFDLRLSREKESATWMVRDGNAPGLAAEPSKVDELMDRLRWLRAARVTSAAGEAVPPAVTITLEADGTPLGRLELERVPPAAAGTAAPASPGETFRLRSSSRPGAVFEVPISGLVPLPRRPADLGASTAAAGERGRS